MVNRKNKSPWRRRLVIAKVSGYRVLGVQRYIGDVPEVGFKPIVWLGDLLDYLYIVAAVIGIGWLTISPFVGR